MRRRVLKSGGKGQDKRKVWDRREDERREEERRVDERRTDQRRSHMRRSDFCPTCGGVLSSASFCRACKVRVVKIRHGRKGRSVSR